MIRQTSQRRMSDILVDVPSYPDMDEEDEETTPPASPSVASTSSSSSSKLSISQQNAQKLLFHFSKTFVFVMESTIFTKSDSGDEEETDYFDDFEKYSSYSTLEQCQAISDEEFAFEKYFPSEQRAHFRDLFVKTAFDIFKSYEYQLVMLVRVKRKISEIAEDIVHRILDNFKESQRGCNPEYIRPEITRQFLIEKALQHSEPEGITYNSEWSAVEILENPGIIMKKDEGAVCVFYQSDWQKNFIGVKKKIGSKYGFRLKFFFETEISILKNFEKVRISSVFPLYLQYQYSLNGTILELCRKDLDRELHIQEEMKTFGVGKEIEQKDKVKEFQQKLQIEKRKEERNSDKVMKQVVEVGETKIRSKLERLEQQGVMNKEEVAKARAGLLRTNYNVRFEVRDRSVAEFPQIVIKK